MDERSVDKAGAAPGESQAKELGTVHDGTERNGTRGRDKPAEASGGDASGTQTDPGSESGPARPPGREIREGDPVILFLEDGKRITVRAGAGDKGTHLGQVKLDDLVGRQYGSSILTNTGHAIYLVRLTLQDHIMSLKRSTQIIYPKDLGTILMKLGVGHGDTVLECGTGSGSLTLALAWMVGPAGRVYSYERGAPFSKKARQNLRRAGLLDRVALTVRDLDEEDFDDITVDAAFLDVREPNLLLNKATRRLAPGGILGMLTPTTNQVTEVIAAIQAGPYIDLEVMETFVRRYKVNAQRFRPEDRMIGHTGFLIFARRVVPTEAFVPVERIRSIPISERAGKRSPREDESAPGAESTAEAEGVRD